MLSDRARRLGAFWGSDLPYSGTARCRKANCASMTAFECFCLGYMSKWPDGVIGQGQFCQVWGARTTIDGENLALSTCMYEIDGPLDAAKVIAERRGQEKRTGDVGCTAYGFVRHHLQKARRVELQ